MPQSTANDGSRIPSPQRTPRGLQTRSRILESAAKLFYVKGVHATKLDDIRVASNTSKSQLYSHFPDKLALIHAVVDMQSQSVLNRERQALRRVRSFAGLGRWRDALVQFNTLQGSLYCCVLGRMSIELSDYDEQSRKALAVAFEDWGRLLVDTLSRLRDLDMLSETADLYQLGTGLLAALQGGYVLAQSAHSSEPMAIALDMALSHIESFAND